MKYKLLAYLPFVLLGNVASAKSLFLVCEATSFPELNFKKMYKKPPATWSKVLEHFVLEGLGGIVVNKAVSWEIKVAEGHITSPEEMSGPQMFSGASVTEAKISAETRFGSARYSYELNRITGKLIYRIYLDTERMTSWRRKHGGNLPYEWKWEQMCTSSSQPKL